MATRRTAEERQRLAVEALGRIQQSQSLSNFPTVLESFMARGIAESEIRPKENVLTYLAWQAKGRQVRRGERGVRVTVWIAVDDREEAGKARMIPRHSVVFHESQTEVRS